MKIDNILDTTTCKSDCFFNDQITIEINDIDDLAVVWFAYNENDKIIFRRLEEKNSKVVPLEKSMWLWRKGGNHGQGSVNITQWLNNYASIISKEKYFYLIVAIYDFKYEHPIFKGGKWSFDAKLFFNGKIKWQNHKFEKSDTINESYGLKYLKIFKLNLDYDKNSIEVTETIEDDVNNNIYETIKMEHNYIKDEKTKKIVHNKWEELKEKKERSNFFIIDILLFLFLGIGTFLFYNHEYIFSIFFIFNIMTLIYFFIRFKLGGKAWELVLRKKQSKELDSFMVVLGLLFTAALGAITSFNFEANSLSNSTLYRIGIFILYISTNLVLLYILTVISTYAINILKTNKRLFLSLIIFIGIGIFVQELVNFKKNYVEKISEVKIVKSISNNGDRSAITK